VIEEVRLVHEKGYRVKEIHEIYEYQVTRYTAKPVRVGFL
jgi:hypothetical protein